MINEKAELSAAANDKLKSFFKRYNDSSQLNNIASANLEIEGVKIEMKNNIKKLMDTTENINVRIEFNLGAGPERAEAKGRQSNI